MAIVCLIAIAYCDLKDHTRNIDRIIIQAYTVMNMATQDAEDTERTITTASEMFRLILVMDSAEAKTLMTKIAHPHNRYVICCVIACNCGFTFEYLTPPPSAV